MESGALLNSGNKVGVLIEIEVERRGGAYRVGDVVDWDVEGDPGDRQVRDLRRRPRFPHLRRCYRFQDHPQAHGLRMLPLLLFVLSGLLFFVDLFCYGMTKIRAFD